MSLTITLIGGPTALIEIDGFRLLTDPTFDAPASYQLPHVKLEKLEGPAIAADAVGEIDAVLLSHDQHSDNLDHSGKEFLARAKRVLTTEAGAKRLGDHAEGFAPWGVTQLKKGGATLTITATPARHGPAGIEPLSGDVIGFVVAPSKSRPIYVSGDTTWFDGVAEVARRFDCGVVLPFAGGADPRSVPSHHGHQRHHRDRARPLRTRRSYRCIRTAGRTSARTQRTCGCRSMHWDSASG